jgi:type IV pilus assembly protein PilW
MSHITFSRPMRQTGVGLVELMVGLVIGIVLSMAAAALYLGTRDMSRGSQAITDVNETGKIALEMIGREIQKAGFYPAQYGMNWTTNNDAAGSYYNGEDATKVAFNSGLFGCDGANYDPATMACGTTTAGKPDSIIINYFATPEFGADSLLGNTTDCLRNFVQSSNANASRSAAGLPLFVSNRFGILAETTSYKDADGNTVSANSLGCHGNGFESGTSTFSAVPVLQGIDDLVIRYGLYDGDGTADGVGQSPTEFMTAANVSAQPDVSGRTAWQRVTAVSVCVLVRSVANGRQEDKTGSERTYADCRGNTVSLPTGDRYVYKTYQRVFAVRNNLSAQL